MNSNSQNKIIIFWVLFLIINSPLFSNHPFRISFQSDFTNYNSQPFWLQSNRWGINDGKIRNRLLIRYENQKNNLIKSNAEIVQVNNRLYFIEGNISVSLQKYLISFGMSKKALGEIDHDLSSGSLILSPNASPLPKFSIESNQPISFEFEPLRFEFNGGISHGLLEKGIYRSRPFIHEKWGYVKIKKNNLSFHLGLIHEAIWGGETKEFGTMPSSISDFMKVFFVQGGKENSTVNERKNALGNHLGIWDLGFSKEDKNYIFKTYLQHPFEDQSGARWLLNWQDGLYGIKIEDKSKRFYINKINIEYVYTMNQSGSTEVSDSTYGWDDYYNHYIYLSGWTNKGRAIGTPFATLGANQARPFVHIENNRIKAVHLGFSGIINSKFSFRHLSSYSKNYGTFFDRNRLNDLKINYKYSSSIIQYSGLLELQINNFTDNDKILLSLSYAYDNGEIFPNSSGIEASIKYKIR